MKKVSTNARLGKMTKLKRFDHPPRGGGAQKGPLNPTPIPATRLETNTGLIPTIHEFTPLLPSRRGDGNESEFGIGHRFDFNVLHIAGDAGATAGLGKIDELLFLIPYPILAKKGEAASGDRHCLPCRRGFLLGEFWDVRIEDHRRKSAVLAENQG